MQVAAVLEWGCAADATAIAQPDVSRCDLSDLAGYSSQTT